MSPEYPYQLVAFLGDEPNIGEGAYQGEMGWYPQIALKRRFSAPSINENNLVSLLSEFASKTSSFQLQTGQLTQPDRMPVKVIDIRNKGELMNFHKEFMAFIGNRIDSRYPDRDGENYFPHITVEYDDELVVDVGQLKNQAFPINKICLIKDGDDTDSHVVAYFNLSR